MDKLTIKTPYGALDIEPRDRHTISVSTQHQQPLVVNRVEVKVSCTLVVTKNGYVDNPWTTQVNGRTDLRHHWYLRRSDPRTDRGKWEDSIPSACYKKTQDAIVQVLNDAIASHPELLVAGAVNEYQQQRSSQLDCIKNAEQAITSSRNELERLEASLTPEMKAYIVERSLGGKQEAE